jgi:vacuolar protein sorting-associated protein 72
MADETMEDTTMRSEAEEDEGASDSGSGSASEGEEEQQKVEWLATSRAKRSTAGNRLNSLLQQEDAEDELELLFQEADDDEVFDDVEADSDVQMDSSDDDDDQGPTAGAEDLEGEKELEKQNRAELKAKRRKLNHGIPKFHKKQVKIDPTASRAHTPATRPKKKSERASWIPTLEDAPTRASSRGTTKERKEQLYQQMVEREVKRLKQLKSMEKAAALKEAVKKPPMTQEDRLRQAVKVEKSNAKSLSRWEEMEQQREEEQRVRLAALQNRTLKGPVLTTWSGMAEWVGGKLKKVGKIFVTDEPKPKPVSKKRKAAEMEEGEAAKSIPVSTILSSVAESQGFPATTPPANVQASVEKDNVDPLLSSMSVPKVPTTLSAIPVEATSFREPPILAPPRQPSPKQEIPVSVTPEPPRASSVLAPPPMHGPYPPPPIPGGRVSSVLAPPPMHGPVPPYPGPPHLLAPPSHPAFILAPPIQPHFDGSTPLPGFGYNFMSPQPQYPTQPQHHPAIIPQPQFQQHFMPSPAPPPPPPQSLTPPPPKVEIAAIQYLIFANFDDEKIKDKDIQTQILFHGQKFTKAPNTLPTPIRYHPLFTDPRKGAKSVEEKCAITGYQARYRDPSTGLPYCSSLAYKRIEQLKGGQFRWSTILGAYVGANGVAARGVPARFLGEVKDETVVEGL